MKCLTTNKKLQQVYFDIDVEDENTIKITQPNGETFYLNKKQVLQALGEARKEHYALGQFTRIAMAENG